MLQHTITFVFFLFNCIPYLFLVFCQFILEYFVDLLFFPCRALCPPEILGQVTVFPPIQTPFCISVLIFFIASLVYKLNSIGDRIHPCLIPFPIFVSFSFTIYLYYNCLICIHDRDKSIVVFNSYSFYNFK